MTTAYCLSWFGPARTDPGPQMHGSPIATRSRRPRRGTSRPWWASGPRVIVAIEHTKPRPLLTEFFVAEPGKAVDLGDLTIGGGD